MRGSNLIFFTMCFNTILGWEWEVERERLGKKEEEAHRVVRGPWVAPPMEGMAKGKEREVETEGSGKEEEEGHRVVRG